MGRGNIEMDAVIFEKQRLIEEANSLLLEAERLSNTPTGKLDKATRSRIDGVLAQASAKKQQAASMKTQEEARARAEQVMREVGAGLPPKNAMEERENFRHYMNTGELRTYAGLDTSSGAAIIPAEFYHKLLEGVAQVTELMSESNVTLIKSDNA